MSDDNPVKDMLERMRQNREAQEAENNKLVDNRTQEEREADLAAGLDITQQEVDVHELPESEIKRAPEKQKVRRIPGALFGKGEESQPPKDPWSRVIPELGKIEVTEAERENFYRRFLHGDRQELAVSIEILPGEFFHCVVRSLTPGEKEAIGFAVARIAATYPNANAPKQLLIAEYWTKMEILTRIVRIEGEDWKPFDISITSDELPEESPKIEELIRKARTHFNTDNRYTLLFRALHMAAAKFTILEDALANRDFSNPSGAV